MLTLRAPSPDIERVGSRRPGVFRSLILCAGAGGGSGCALCEPSLVGLEDNKLHERRQKRGEQMKSLYFFFADSTVKELRNGSRSPLWAGNRS